MPHEEPINPAVVTTSKDMLHLVCVACGASFELDQQELHWYRVAGLHFPKRCWGCRQARGRARSQEAKP
jgi:putative zinc ribbon protein